MLSKSLIKERNLQMPTTPVMFLKPTSSYIEEGQTIEKNSRAKGLPWTFGKGFDTACPVSRFIPKNEIKDPTSLNVWCKVNDKLLQDCLLSDMVFTIEDMISYTSRYMTLEPNDLILTGSPGNNGPIRPGDVVEAGLGQIMTIKFPVKSMEN
ncbi:hypothetical protein LSTR_LSTR009138 [Laodelphax striatellus]|uniref:oxaloacetate tautomerase n=1 Tax=Laodelphax striatellus TaxID=195883 RepID=A0A482XPQ5_LAOST|nr:hypothetical protein LSTR_LSTR009138 [Laodelphax striatellus]